MNATTVDAVTAGAETAAVELARSVLIALNATSTLPRASVCRLGRELARWLATDTDPAALDAGLGLARGSLQRAFAVRDRASSLAAGEEAKAAALGARLLTLVDAAYPPALLELPLPPPVLYVQGALPSAPAVTIVGSRRADLYGLTVAETFGRDLAAAGATVVSGFAHGIDAAAHRGALAAPEGRTVAVLGCGLGVDYPRGQTKLGRRIGERGALVSEFPVGTAPARWQFPVRNRILAALAQAVLVVRATPRSGSLITVRHALDLGRDVYAIPGRIHEAGSQGPNQLLRDGAFVAQEAADILAHLDPPLGAAAPKPKAARPSDASPLLAALPPAEAMTIEELAAATGMDVQTVVGELLGLELEGTVRRLPGGAYCRGL